MSIHLLEIDAHTGAGVETLYIAEKSYKSKPTDTPANQIYKYGLMRSGELNRQLFSNGGTIGKPSINVGQFEIDNADGSRSGWLSYGIGGRKFRLYSIERVSSPLSSRVLIFTGTMRGFSSDNLSKSLKLRTRDKMEALDKQALTELYGGSTNAPGASADGDTTMLNTPKPVAFGDNLKFTPKQVNKFDLIYQVSARLVSLINVYDGGVQLTSDGDYATLALLQAATIGAGKFATCLASGYFRLQSAPVKQITADCMAQSVTWAANNDLYEAGPIGKAILTANGFGADLDDDSFDDLKCLGGSNRCGIYIQDTSTTVLDAVSKVLASVGAAITSTADDKIKAVALCPLPLPTNITQARALVLPPGSPIDTFTIRDINADDATFQLFASPQAEGDGVPAYWINLNYSPYGTTQSRGDLAGAVNDTQARDLALAYRQTVDLDESIKDIHPLAQALTFDTQLTNLIGANANARRLLVMYGQRRDFIQISVSLDRFIKNASIDLGSEVAIVLDHLGYSPKYLYVVGIDMKFGERKVTMTLWG